MTQMVTHVDTKSQTARQSSSDVITTGDRSFKSIHEKLNGRCTFSVTSIDKCASCSCTSCRQTPREGKAGLPCGLEIQQQAKVVCLLGQLTGQPQLPFAS